MSSTSNTLGPITITSPTGGLAIPVQSPLNLLPCIATTGKHLFMTHQFGNALRRMTPSSDQRISTSTKTCCRAASAPESFDIEIPGTLHLSYHITADVEGQGINKKS